MHMAREIRCGAILLCLLASTVAGLRLNLKSYSKEEAAAKFKASKSIVYTVHMYGNILQFDVEDKWMLLHLSYGRMWKDSTLPKFPVNAKGKLPHVSDEVLWQPPLLFPEDEYEKIISTTMVRGDNWVYNRKRFALEMPCHRLRNYRYPKDRFKCTLSRNVWNDVKIKQVCISTMSFFFRGLTSPTEKEMTKSCNISDSVNIQKDLHSIFPSDWQVISISEFFNPDSPKSMEVIIERQHRHFLVTEVLAAIAIGIIVIFQSLLPPEMGQRLLVGGFGVLMGIVYISDLQSMDVVRDGYDFRLTWLGLGLLVMQALIVVESVFAWNLCQRTDVPPQWINDFPLVGAKSISDDPRDQWRNASTVIGRLHFAINLVTLIVLFIVSIPV